MGPELVGSEIGEGVGSLLTAILAVPFIGDNLERWEAMRGEERWEAMRGEERRDGRQ